MAYFAGVTLVFFIAVGVGATVAAVVGLQVGGSNPEKAGSATTLESTGMEASGSPNKPKGTADTASFVHRADQENSRGDYTYISDPSINEDNNAVVLVSITSDRKGTEDPSYDHNVGVWYEGGAGKWAIFNQDRAPVPEGTAFEVIIPQASTSFVHRADLLNTAGNYTYLDDKLTNGDPDAVLSVTQNWNPGGGGGVYNDHPVGAVYDAKLQKWGVYNRDGASMPKGAAFNIAVSVNADKSAK